MMRRRACASALRCAAGVSATYRRPARICLTRPSAAETSWGERVCGRPTAVLLTRGVAAAAGVGAGAADSGRPARAVAQAYAQQDPSGARADYVRVKGDGDTSGGTTTHVMASTRGGHGTASASAAV